MKVGIIGAGTLGKALVNGLKDNVEIVVSDVNDGEYEGVQIIADNRKVAQDSDLVVLAVKPQIMADVLEEIKGDVSGKLVVSFAAGLRSQFFESRLDARVARAMTNLAARHGHGVTVYKMGELCSPEDKEKVKEILGYLGAAVEVDDEELLDVAIGISGSGVAYFIWIIDRFIDAAKSFGMNDKLAKQVVLETMKGSVSLVKDDEDHEGIVGSIATKGGTTEEGLRELEEKDVNKILQDVLVKTIEKCKELGGKSE